MMYIFEHDISVDPWAISYDEATQIISHHKNYKRKNTFSDFMQHLSNSHKK